MVNGTEMIFRLYRKLRFWILKITIENQKLALA